jgi:large repetitive protein
MTTKIALTNIADTALATLTGPKITTIVYSGTETATDTAGGETINLTGAGFQSGCNVLVASTSASVVTFISSTQISFVAPVQTAGTYVIYVINPDGGTAISIPGISYSGTPTWTTTAGSLGTAYEAGSISATLTATGDAPITYTLASGTLPTGSSLASNGTLSGTAPATASATTYNFTITAKDAQNQTTNRAFSLTINPDVVTWSSPANLTTYNVYTNAAIANECN